MKESRAALGDDPYVTGDTALIFFSSVSHHVRMNQMWNQTDKTQLRKQITSSNLDF
jgi:hypothetical protein